MRLEAGGWQLEAGGWRLETWKLTNTRKVLYHSMSCPEFGSKFEILQSRTDDTLAERSRRRPAKPMGSPHVGSNPRGVVYKNMKKVVKTSQNTL